LSIDPVDKPFSSKLTNSFDYTYTRWNELAENEVERKEGNGGKGTYVDKERVGENVRFRTIIQSETPVRSLRIFSDYSSKSRTFLYKEREGEDSNQ